MNIQFSKQAAQDACDELSEKAEAITLSRGGMQERLMDMQSVWQGPLASTMLSQLRQHDDVYVQISDFVTSLNEHIAACKRNYELASDTNRRRLKSIANMFK